MDSYTWIYQRGPTSKNLNLSEWTQGAVETTSQKQRAIRTDGETRQEDPCCQHTLMMIINNSENKNSDMEIHSSLLFFN